MLLNGDIACLKKNIDFNSLESQHKQIYMETLNKCIFKL